MIKRHSVNLDFEGICPFHKDCLEGLAAGPSIAARTGIRGENIPENHPVWDIQAHYIAQAAVNATLTLAHERIVFGGGVMEVTGMLERVQKNFEQLLNNYVTLLCPLNEYLTLTSVSENGSATLGNFALAKSVFY